MMTCLTYTGVVGNRKKEKKEKEQIIDKAMDFSAIDNLFEEKDETFNLNGRDGDFVARRRLAIADKAPSTHGGRSTKDDDSDSEEEVNLPEKKKPKKDKDVAVKIKQEHA